MRVLMVLPVAFGLSACVEVGQGGTGQLMDGTPIIAKATTKGGLTDGFTYTITSLDGLNCSGYLPLETTLLPSATREIALTCANGATGRGIVTYSSSDTSIVFKLSDGRQGSATI